MSTEKASATTLTPDMVIRIQEDPPIWRLRHPHLHTSSSIHRDDREKIAKLTGRTLAAALLKQTRGRHISIPWLAWIIRQLNLNGPSHLKSTQRLVLIEHYRYNLGFDPIAPAYRHGLPADDYAYLARVARDRVNALLSNAYNRPT